MSIEHKNPVDSRASAPYNFVPAPDHVMTWECPPDRDRFYHDRFHGCLELEITTETQVYTRCAYPLRFDESEINKTPERQHFYHWGDPAVPILPGSSLRGCIRNLVEILSYARLSRIEQKKSRVSDAQLMYRAVADQRTSMGKAYNTKFLKVSKDGNRTVIDYPNSNVRSGYLERGTDQSWVIRPAFTHEGESFIRVNDHAVSGNKPLNSANRKCWVKPEKRQRRAKGNFDLSYAVTSIIYDQPGPGLQPGTLVISGEMSTKHMHTVVYERDPSAKVVPIPDEMWKLYSEDRGIPNRKLKNAGDVVFYLLDAKGQLDFFGPNLFFRLPYDLRPTDLIIDDSNSKALDFAESVFGTVHPERIHGRVVFSDGEPASGQSGLVSDHAVFPEILSTPKPSSYQNYLVQTDDRQQNLRSYLKGDKGKTTLRGFKRYWHRGNEELATNVSPGDTQHTAIRPVRSGAKFNSIVHFENLTLEELGGLLTAIELPQSCRHHFGMGKPRGFGSIKIAVKKTNLIDPNLRYQSLNNSGSRSDSASVAVDAKNAFAQRVLKHVGIAEKTLWQIPRLQELLCLLEWSNKLHSDEIRYLSPNNGGEKNILRDRDVLPAPSQIAGKKSSTQTDAKAKSHQGASVRPKEAPDPEKLKRLVTQPKVEGVVEKVRGSDHLINVDGVQIRLPHKAFKKRKLSKNDFPEGTKITIRVLPDKKGEHHEAELL